MGKTALITGVTGQDGSFLAELLLDKGYEVHGTVRRSSMQHNDRIRHLEGNGHFFLHYADMTDALSLMGVVCSVRPDEVYNLAAQSHVKVSFAVPEYTADTDATGTLRLLEALRMAGLDQDCRFYQASTSELFGKVQETPQSETTPFYPYSPYAAAKQYAYWIVRNYREAYGMYAVNGILFNHESERRGKSFVTRKITLAAANIAAGKKERLSLGNLDALRDWGYAGDYVECMWRMLQQDDPQDYVIATGEQHSVREFCTLAFRYAGIELQWQGAGLHEKGIDSRSGRVCVEVSPDYFRPTDVTTLLGDPSKAREELGWDPKKTSFADLVRIMMEHDLRAVKWDGSNAVPVM